MNTPEEKEETAWLAFACAALSSGKPPKAAAKAADDMLGLYDDRFSYSGLLSPEAVLKAHGIDPEATKEEPAEVKEEKPTEETPVEAPAKKVAKKKTAKKKSAKKSAKKETAEDKSASEDIPPLPVTVTTPPVEEKEEEK